MLQVYWQGQVRPDANFLPALGSLLGYEGSGPSSGIVIEEVGGVVASLLDQCVARAGTEVGDYDEHRFGVTSAETRRISSRWLRIVALAIASPLSVPIFFFTVFCTAMAAAVGENVPFFTAATICIAIVWVLSEASVGIPFTRLCASACSSRGEYLIGSDMETVMLRGRGRAVPSITHSETMIPFHVLQDVRILVIILGAILFVLKGLNRENSLVVSANSGGDLLR